MRVRFCDETVLKLALRRNDKCVRQYAAFDEVDESELIAAIDDYGARAVVREVDSVEPDVVIPCCAEITGAVVANALGISPQAILVQPILWERLQWFYETESGRGLRSNRVV